MLTLIHFALNVFIMGSVIEGKKVFKFTQTQRPLDWNVTRGVFGDLWEVSSKRL